MSDLNERSKGADESTRTGPKPPDYTDPAKAPTHSLPVGEQNGEGSPSSPSVPFRYHPIRLHAQGGLGEVHIAADTELHRDVALKRIQPGHAEDSEACRRFVREAETTAQLQHPGVVPVYGLVRDSNGQPWYAMRFIEGQSLQDAIVSFHRAAWPSRGSSEFRLALRELLSRFVAVCQTLAYAHSRGVIHRDLKPENIMLGRFGETLVVDWGLARPFGEKQRVAATEEPQAVRPSREPDEPVTREGAVVGTPAFMSPEQAAGQVDLLGPASDIYSLGAILYILLTGQRPFQADHLAALLSKVQAGKFPSPRQRNGSVPRALESICLKAMALLPENRYRTAQDLAVDIVRWLSDEPVSVHREPLRVRLWRWERRHQWKLPRIMGILFLVCFLFWFGTFVFMDSHLRNQLNKLQEQLKRIQNPGLPTSRTVRHKGLTADAWGQRLYDADRGVSAEAAFALSSIGEEGAHFLLEGMKSPTFHIREQSLDCFHPSFAKKWKAQVLPVLRAILKDRNWPGLGEKAAAVIRYAEIVDAIPDLRGFREWVDLPGAKARLDLWIAELEAIEAP
jgi:serine/threonine protein kinase